MSWQKFEVFQLSLIDECCRARLLTDEQRSALTNYFSIYKGTENGLAKLMLPFSGTTHPCVDRTVAIIKDAWTEVLLCHVTMDASRQASTFCTSLLLRLVVHSVMVLHLTPSRWSC